MPSGHFEQVEKIQCSTLFPRKFYSFKAEFEVFSERNPLLSVVKVQFLAWLSIIASRLALTLPIIIEINLPQSNRLDELLDVRYAIGDLLCSAFGIALGC